MVGLFADVFVPPDPGNSGNAVGAALSGSQTRITVTIQWDDSRGEQAPVQLAIESLI